MTVHLEPWSADDLGLLHRLNAPEMTAHLGGPESDARVADRHQRYLTPGSGMFRVVLDGVVAGSAGFWAKQWRGEAVYEVGWSVLPECQGRGVAAAAAAAVLERARAAGGPRWVHAFPSVGNAASNAVCRKAGFTLLGEVSFEYPPGAFMRCNDWGVELGITP
ncbi:GNAT family N-acetyltransferase [Saccharothrix variisporea]|uniref:RimJ/RimL family protein N-acetyltransferase n=1 Tax=Saccharothrix variisporea TaxID=543527 RepID=A0A495XJT2_9PSEU|nr:GNAT family N-acetyltransferase [Saccharothrix variisporea]RKT71878.1 RimJ/RimL family protein N-acetyltransferase [Saccharothrix variisporea]